MLDKICAVWSMPIENNIIIWLQALGGEGTLLYYVMNFLSMFGKEIAVVLVAAIYWGPSREKGERLAYTLLTTFLANSLIKNIICRERPFNSDDRIQNLRDESGYSFPSGHSMISAALYPSAAQQVSSSKRKLLTISAIALSALVAISRMYVGAHYLTDVICGLVLGFIFLALINFAFTHVKNTLTLWIGLLVVGLVGFFYCDSSDFFTGYGATIGLTCALVCNKKLGDFPQTNVRWKILLRAAIGMGGFLALNELIKLPFSNLIATNQSFERYFRVVRYGIVTFVLVGLYPRCFASIHKLFTRIFNKQTPDTSDLN